MNFAELGSNLIAFVFLVPNLKPGTWELHIYVEDRWMNVSNINILVGSSSFYDLSFYYYHLIWSFSFPGDLGGKKSACNVGDLDSIPGLGRAPGGGHGSPSILSWKNPMDREAWWATVLKRIEHD